MIWKTVLAITDQQEVEVPQGSQLLCAKEQFEQICLWYACDPAAPKEKRNIFIVGTGRQTALNEGRYLGTASLAGGAVMFHVFEQTKKDLAEARSELGVQATEGMIN